jgi:DNA-directed RNA polymerase I subunit RPA49
MYDLREDLRIEQTAYGPFQPFFKDFLLISSHRISQYYQELGCRVVVPSDSQRAGMKITKAGAQGHKIAKLRLPLEFPKNRVAARKKR